jgi:hypothetical protein
MSHVFRGLIVVALLAGASWSQSAPDLSGSWTLEDGASAPAAAPIPPTSDGPPPPPPPPRQVALKIAQTQTAFRIERTLSTPGDAAIQEATYRLDGSETTSQMGPIVNTTTASWNGRELLLSTVQTAAGNTGAIAGQVVGNLQERFTVEAGRLVIESLRRTRTGQSNAKRVYTRVR